MFKSQPDSPAPVAAPVQDAPAPVRFSAMDVLAELGSVRAILENRAYRIAEAGGDCAVTMRHIHALRCVEALLCGKTNVVQLAMEVNGLLNRPQPIAPNGDILILLGYHAPEHG